MGLIDLPSLKNERERYLWSIIESHIAAETASDMRSTLDSITADCRYEFPFEGLGMLGAPMLAPYYARLFANWPGEMLQRKILRFWLMSRSHGSGDDSILFEARNTFRMSDGSVVSLPSAAILSVNGDKLAEEWIFVSHPTAWLAEFARPTVVELGSDVVLDGVPNAAIEYLCNIGPANAANTMLENCCLELPYDALIFTGRNAVQTALRQRVTGQGGLAICAVWRSSDGTAIVLTKESGLAASESAELSVVRFEQGLVAHHIIYSVRDHWQR